VSPRWLAPRSLALHVGLVAWVAGCSLAAWWQVGRAFQGNQYSYLYAVEWPGFALLGMFVWWRSIHVDSKEQAATLARDHATDDARVSLERVQRRDRAHEDPALAAYNDHLAELALAGRRKSWKR
jgi:hypothetical protein